MLKNLWYKNSINFCPCTQWVGWRWGLFSGVCCLHVRWLAVGKTIINYSTTFSPWLAWASAAPFQNKINYFPRTLPPWWVVQSTKLAGRKYISHHRTTFSSVEAKKLSYQLSGVCVKRYRKLEPKLVHCVTQLSWKPMGVYGAGRFRGVLHKFVAWLQFCHWSNYLTFIS